jgi:hypothetical protein
MRVLPLAIVFFTGAALAPCSALGQSAAFPAAPPPEPTPPPLETQGPPASTTPSADQPKRGPYQQVLGPYQRNPPKLDEKKDNLRPEYALVEPAGIKTHDGLYFRLAGGLGAMSDGIDGEGSWLARGSVTDQTAFSGTASGFAFATEVAIGFTPVASLVIGGGVYTVTAPAPESDESGIAGPYEFRLTQMELFALFGDYYVNPRSGLHFQAGGGFCAMIMGQGAGKAEGPTTHAHTAVGPGLMLGGGYEWWIADQWGAGILARAIYGWSSGSDPRGVSWEHGTLGWSLMASATYH